MNYSAHFDPVAPHVLEALPRVTDHSGMLGDTWGEKVRLLLYLVTPEETFVKTMEDVPNVLRQVLPLVLVIMAAEFVVLRLLGRRDEVRSINYVINLTCTAIHDSFSEFVFRGAELMAYSWLYDHYRLCTLPWDSPVTFLVALLAVDYFAYWWHRVSHEVNVVWAAHEFHHNSSEYNLGTAFRLGLVMRIYRWLFYMPTALMGLPPATMWMHMQLGFVFNGMSHVTFVPSLGKVVPGIGHLIELVFITPSHHKVHHAMNRYAIDRNYGVVLVLWDRLHGTFAAERDDEQLVFGTLVEVRSHDLLRLQNEPYVNLWKKVQSMDTLGDKLRAVFYGPGWMPGRPRLGLREELPDVRERPKRELQQPTATKVYLVVNSFVAALVYWDVVSRVEEVSSLFKTGTLAFLYFSYTAIGALFDNKPHGPMLEIFRNIAFLVLQFVPATPLIANPVLGGISVTFSVGNLAVCPMLLYMISEAKEVTSGTPFGAKEQSVTPGTLNDVKAGGKESH